MIEISDYSILAMMLRSPEPPTQELPEIVELKELNFKGNAGPGGDEHAIAHFVEVLRRQQRTKLVHSQHLFYPETAFVHRANLEGISRQKAVDFFREYVNSQLNINPDETLIHIVSADTGIALSDFATQKDLFFCGVGLEELRTFQRQCVQFGFYPERIELASVSNIAAAMNYIKSQKRSTTTLLVETSFKKTRVFLFTGFHLELARDIPFGIESMLPILQEKLKLSDPSMAKRFLFAETFDFSEIEMVLLGQLLPELQTLTRFFEVKTGQAIGQLMMSAVPRSLDWMGRLMGRELGIPCYPIDFAYWMKRHAIICAESVRLDGLDGRWLGLFGLLTSRFNQAEEPTTILTEKEAFVEAKVSV